MKPLLSRQSPYRRGFTLVEAILVIAVLGIISAIVVPRVANIAEASRDQDAISRAHVLNQAMFTYLQRVPGAASQWTSAANNANRYTLLFNGGYLPGSSATLDGFTPTGFTYTFPSSLNFTSMRVTINRTGGGTLAY